MQLRLLPIAIALFTAACSASEKSGSTPSLPVAPPPPVISPTVVLSTDSVVATLTAGADKMTQDIDVTAGTAAAVSGLVVADPSVGAGQPTGWVSASLSGQTAPARLTVTVNPGLLPAGKYDAQFRVTATNAEAKIVRVSLVVRPRPRLVVDRSALSMDAELGAAFATQTINVSSVDGPVDGLSLGKASCGSGPSGWLSATLSAPSTPTTVKLDVAPTGLQAGVYSCSFVLSTSEALVDSASQAIHVSLTLRAVPRIVVSADSVKSLGFRLADGNAVSVAITNGGTGTLTGLSLGDIKFSPEASGWLTAKLDSTTAPTALTLTPSARSITAGTFTATVPVMSNAPGVLDSPKSVTMTFQVAPIPSGLAVVPNRLTATLSRSAATPYAGSVSVVASGDISLAKIAFAGISSTPFGWISSIIGCTGASFSTPCVSTVTLIVLSSMTPGTYAGTVTYKSFDTGQTGTLTVSLTVVP